MPVELNASRNAGDGEEMSEPVTIVGLFEDEIDTRRALAQLRKKDVPAHFVSVLIRLSDSGSEQASNGEGVVARAISACDLEGVADWLLGFVTIEAERLGTYLVAGPVGASLAGDKVTEIAEGSDLTPIGAVLNYFGFGPDEAAYMDSRITAGSWLVSVTCAEREALLTASKTFSNENAVYIPTAATGHDIAEHADELLDLPPERSSDGDVIVTDAVARFFRISGCDRADEVFMTLRDRPVVDPDGDEVGTLVDFIAETLIEGDEQVERDEVRYGVVAFGGIFGLGRHHAAIPIDRFDLASDPVRITVDRDVLRDAPAFNRVAPFSRAEEHTVCAYFGATPYWSESS